MAHYEERLTHRVLYSGNLVEVWQDRVELENGHSVLREVVDHCPGVCVLARKGDQVCFVRQYRYPTQQELLELPAGKLDDPKEEPEQGALRELKEETGLVPDRLVYLGYAWVSPGFCTERLFLYYADGLHQEEDDPDTDELLTAQWYSLEEIKAMMAAGELTDGKSLSALALAGARGLLD